MSGTNPGDPTPGNAIWSAPEPQAVLGLNASMTYGSQFQCAIPINYQIGIGANYQLLIDPVGIFKAFPDIPLSAASDAIFGLGALGNIQMTLGTSVQLNMGKSYSIDLGPSHQEAATHGFTGCKNVQKALCVVLSLTTLIYYLAYGIDSSDDGRAALTITYQLLSQVMIDAIMLVENANFLGYGSLGDLLNQALFRSGLPALSPAEGIVTVWAELAIITAVIVPPILDSIGEIHLDQAKAQQAH
jgi:hypothetical protein